VVLSQPGRAQQSKNFTGINRKADLIDSRERPESLDDLAKFQNGLSHGLLDLK
jgi:hypothetical protein